MSSLSPAAVRCGPSGSMALLLHSTDAGRSWRQDTSFTANLAGAQGSLPTLEAIFFADAQNGWAVGQRGLILHTEDGGQAWEVRRVGGSATLRDVYFANARQGWVVGYGGTIRYTADGGQTWDLQSFDNPSTSAQTGGSRFDFRAVHFWREQRGWVVGSEGTILYTDDGGQQWVPQRSGTAQDLWDISFVNGETGYVVGSNIILKTTNRGQTWQALDVEAEANDTYLSVHFFDAQTGLVVGINTILLTNDGGQSWQRYTLSGRERLLGVQFADAQTAYIVGSFGAMLKTIDGGQSWHRLNQEATQNLVSVYFISTQTGFIVGADSPEGILLKTTDGGTTWQPIDTNIPDFVFGNVLFINAQTGFIAGTTAPDAPVGVVLKTTDGGTTWQSVNTNIPGVLYGGVHFINAQTGFIAGTTTLDGSVGTLLKTTDGGTTWQSANTNIPGVLYGNVHFIDAQTGFIIGTTTFDDPEGTLLKTTDGGTTWQSVNTNIPGSILGSVHFIDAQTGFIVGLDGSEGVVLKTTDGGTTWQSHPTGLIGSQASVALYDVFFVDAQTGFITGYDNTLLKTTDGGETWADPRRYGWWPAPWYYLSLVVVLFLLRPALKRPDDRPAAETSVADELISDRPLRPGDPDPLDFGVVALGLSRFLRNRNTQPPLTIAVTGPWGSGKSSLMNLLRGDLAQYGFRSVWFNAWHHQTEEHLLAALLENIRKQAVPPWWHPQNWAFRTRLLWLRRGRYGPLLIILLFVFALSLGHFVARPDHLQDAFDAIPTSIAEVKAIFGSEADVPAPTSPNTSAADTSALALLVSSMLGLLVLTLRGLVAFGVTPARLLGSLRRNARIRDLEAQTSFRYRFAREFEEVTRALRPRTMVIMIDDLDRCRPQNVLTILEAINFLVSSGDCYIVLGMEMDRVEQYVAKGFEDIIQQEPDFATHYLEKLVNIEVPVPLTKPDDPKAQALLSRELRQRRAQDQAALHRRIRTIERLQRNGQVLMVAAFLVSAFLLAQWLTPKAPPEPDTPAVASVVSATPTDTTGTAQDTGIRDTTTTTPPSDEGSRIARLVPGDTAEPPWWMAAALATVLLGLGLWRLSIRPGAFENDSPNFAKALTVWYPAISAQSSTPRALKRFVNRVRYLAMRQRAQTPYRSLAERLALRLNGKAETTPITGRSSKPTAIPEEMLVALSAVHNLNPDWLERIETVSAAVLPTPSQPLKEEELELMKALRNCIKGHEATSETDEDFNKWPPSEAERDRLLAMLGSIRVR